MKKDFYEDIVAETRRDFEERREARRSYELQWRLNLNFLLGNQYCEISPRGDIEDSPKQYFWQEREVFNHIAPIVETRMAKLARVRPKISVRPSSNDSADINTARLSSKVLRACEEENRLFDLVGEANMWCETCGSVFYKIVWNSAVGKVLGRKKGTNICEGDVEISLCPPYEIYPDDLNASGLGECRSLIHARAYPVDAIKDIWGVDVEPEDVGVFAMECAETAGGMGYTASVPNLVFSPKKNHAVLIEKYVAPTNKDPYGKLIVTAGNTLLYYGDLPYGNGKGGKPGFPFVRQVAIPRPGGFYGVSVIERIIPVQRAYNAVKNRKHEFLNRIAMGVLAVEDGSVDTDNLEEEGLSPGKVLIYRQGSVPPKLLEAGSVPTDFSREEDKLMSEFIRISGVSEMMTYSHTPTNVTSGTALNLLVEQDDTRMSISADSLRSAVKEIGYQALRLYKQFARSRRLKKIGGDTGEVETICFNSSDINADDLVFDTDNELMETPASRRNTVMDLLKLGLLNDENGKLGKRMKCKVLEMLGLGNWENSQDISELHIKLAMEENLSSEDRKPEVSELDDHELHIAEHTKYVLAHGDPVIEEHIKEHRKFLSVTKSLIKEGNNNE